MYKLLEKIQRKFVYQIAGDANTFMNLLTFTTNTRRKTNVRDGSKLHKRYKSAFSRIEHFFNWCDEMEVDPYNFTIKNDNYVITSDMMINVQIDINRYGRHWKHYIDEQAHEINVDGVYNLKLEHGVLYYTYMYNENDFLKDYRYDEETYFVDEEKLTVDRKTDLLLTDYLSLALDNFNVTKELDTYYQVNGTNVIKIKTDNGMSKAVVKDFEFFYERNKVECPKCKKLVDNAFDDYMIQFYKHDGC